MKAIQKIITIFVWISCLLFAGLLIINGYELSLMIKISIPMLIVCITVTILYFAPIPDRVKAIVVLLIAGLACHGVSVVLKGNSITFTISFLVLAGSVLFFDPKVIGIYSAIFLPVTFILYKINPEYIVGKLSRHSFGMFEIIVYLVITICLYIGTKAGSIIMKRAVDDELRAQETAEKIQQLAVSAHQHAVYLQDHVVITDKTVGQLAYNAKEANNEISKLMDSESQCIEIFHQLNDRFQQSIKEIEQNYYLIDTLKESFVVALDNVQESQQFSGTASNSLNDILNTVKDARDCIVSSLHETEKIGKIVNDIDAIASRTNLLAINASIEAARVGEKGHGFQIVAEQIRTLSVQSKQASENIRTILSRLMLAINSIENRINHGLSAVNHGIDNLDYIMKGLNTIDYFSNQSKEMLVKEAQFFERVKEQFTQMTKEVHHSMENANNNKNDLDLVANAVDSQTNRVHTVYEQLQGMEELANKLTIQFEQ